MSQQIPDSPLAADARRAFLIWLFAGLWLLAVVAGLCVFWSWNNRPDADNGPNQAWGEVAR